MPNITSPLLCSLCIFGILSGMNSRVPRAPKSVMDSFIMAMTVGVPWGCPRGAGGDAPSSSSDSFDTARAEYPSGVSTIMYWALAKKLAAMPISSELPFWFQAHTDMSRYDRPFNGNSVMARSPEMDSAASRSAM